MRVSVEIYFLQEIEDGIDARLYRAKAATKMTAARRLLNPSPVWGAELVKEGRVVPTTVFEGAGTVTEATVVAAG